MFYDLQLVITDFIWMEEVITGNEVKSADWIEVCIWLLKPVELNDVLVNTRSDLIITEPDDKLKTCILVGLLFVKAVDKKWSTLEIGSHYILRSLLWTELTQELSYNLIRSR